MLGLVSGKDVRPFVGCLYAYMSGSVEDFLVVAFLKKGRVEMKQKMMWKSDAWCGFKALIALGLLALVPSVRAEAGFVKAIFTGLPYDGTSSIWEAENRTVVADFSEIYAINSNLIPTQTTWGYGTYMQFEGNVDYFFRTYFDDHATVKIDDVELLPQGNECADRTAVISFPTTGWHKVEFRFANNGGGGGCTSTSYCGVLCKKGTGDWQRLFADTETFETVAPEGAGSVAPPTPTSLRRVARLRSLRRRASPRPNGRP